MVLWLRGRIVEAYPTLSADQIVANTNCVIVNFAGSGGGATLGCPGPRRRGCSRAGARPARAVDVLFGVRLHRYGIDAHAGRISIAERWSQWAKRDWAAYVGHRVADDRGGIDTPKPTKETC